MLEGHTKRVYAPLNGKKSDYILEKVFLVQRRDFQNYSEDIIHSLYGSIYMMKTAFF